MDKLGREENKKTSGQKTWSSEKKEAYRIQKINLSLKNLLASSPNNVLNIFSLNL